MRQYLKHFLRQRIIIRMVLMLHLIHKARQRKVVERGTLSISWSIKPLCAMA